ncbi:MFS transporter, partial [Candidatus Bathyarchaeota archaeon]|nr:MFS transporter [Candidatus Bathyarchaeota archaeon]
METVKRLQVGFGRDMNLLTGSMFTRRIVMGFLQVVRAIYFALLGFSPVEIGLLLSIATFLSAIHHITFGYLCDRYGRKPFLILGTIFAAARTALFAVSTDFWVLALA